jgi:hypothetical protein|uniref:Uncharacterized protein n=1 Tax=viral metagenome TaxID=1070528 RepID=A0A6C0H0B9_9ZZZZ
MKEINIKKYIIEDYDENIDFISKYIDLNCKNDKFFYKFIKICMKFKIYLYYLEEGEYKLRTNKSLMRLINIKKSEITQELGKMILKLYNFDKYLEQTSDNFSDIYDTKNKIDRLYNDYSKNYKYLVGLLKILDDKITDEILKNYTTKEFSLNTKNNIIDEYCN